MTELYTGISWKRLKERTRLGDLGIEERITLKCVLIKQDVRAWNGILEVWDVYVPATLVLEFAGSTPAEDVGFFGCPNIPQNASFGWEVKESVPCPSYAACKRT